MASTGNNNRNSTSGKVHLRAVPLRVVLLRRALVIRVLLERVLLRKVVRSMGRIVRF